jgi:hypothetical protein
MRHVSVGRYTTYEGAALAARHLIDRGHERDDLLIVAHHLHSPTRRRLPLRLVRGTLLGVLWSAFALTAGLVLLAASARSPAREALLWSAAAVSVAAFIGTLPAWARVRWEEDGQAGTALEPDHFDVLCAENPLEARHRLARWWDPAAPPANDDACRNRPAAIRRPHHR